jgi:probable rRNA maturation factor
MRVSPAALRPLLRKALAHEKLCGAGEVTVRLLDDTAMRALNRRYLGHRGSTDVIAFTLQRSGRGGLIADVAVCTDTALRQARQFGTNALFEVKLYAVHGILHVAGHRDDTARRRSAMNARAASIIQKVALCPSTKPKR